MKNTDRKWPKILLVITVAAVIVFFAFRAYYRWTDDFRLANITYEMPYNPNWETNPNPEEYAILSTLVQQPFTYVGKGAQAYAFASKDKKYVIKFFKFKHLKPNSFIEMFDGLPFITEYNEWQSSRKDRLRKSVFDGHKLAFDVHKNESGLVYIHLNKTSDLELKIKLIDKIGVKRNFNLDDVIFVVQEFAETTRQALTSALESRDLELAKKKMDGIITLYLSEYEKGIYDRDHGVMHNTGFVGEKPIHLDVGKLTKDKKMKQTAYNLPDMMKVVSKFEIWLRKNYPDDYSELITFLEARLSQIYGEKITLHQ